MASPVAVPTTIMRMSVVPVATDTVEPVVDESVSPVRLVHV